VELEAKEELDVDGEPYKLDLVCTKASRDLEETPFVKPELAAPI